MKAGELVRETVNKFSFNKYWVTHFDFSYIPPGTFMMGSDKNTVLTGWRAKKFIPDSPKHRVTITKPFLMLRTEVTIGQFDAIYTDVSKAIVLGAGTYASPVNSNRAASSVNYSMAALFCNELSDKFGLPHAYKVKNIGSAENIPGSIGYRLPTEAELEYACRAGSNKVLDTLTKSAWYSYNSKSSESEEVAKKAPNAWNLYDMLGNVWEWTDESPYEYGVDAPSVSLNRVLRGGSWRDSKEYISPTVRLSEPMYDSFGGYGFRICRTVE